MKILIITCLLFIGCRNDYSTPTPKKEHQYCLYEIRTHVKPGQPARRFIRCITVDDFSDYQTKDYAIEKCDECD